MAANKTQPTQPSVSAFVAAIVGCDRYQYHFSPRKAGTVLYLAPPLKNYAALLNKLGKHKVSGDQGVCAVTRHTASPTSSAISSAPA